MFKDRTHILRQLKKGLGILLMLAIVAELFFFPSLANLYGCLMAAIAYGVFMLFLKEKYIRRYPFAFFMYVSMFMYRYLPLIATIAEGKPITYGFERPFETFMFEILLFLISSLAFYLACSTSNTSGRNNILQNTLYDLKFFETTPAILWGMGLVGLLIRIYNFGAGDVEYGNVGGKFLLGLNYLMYAPLVLLFPSLLNLKYTKQKFVWLYAVLIFVINIASNSRQSIITPIATIALLFFLYVVLNNIKITKLLSPLKIITLGLGLFLILSFLSRVSVAMLYTRAIRANVNKLELFEETVTVLQNYELMKRLIIDKDQSAAALSSYQEGWTEDYVDNFMLARYANMRITDQTLFYAEKKGYANRQMQEAFKNSIIGDFPGPLLQKFNITIDKKELEFSRGDLLYGSGFGGYRVTSHVGDGLATFGYWYFLIQMLVFFIIFKLLNSFTYNKGGTVIYAPFALISIFSFLGKFRNANGVTADISYIFRGYIQGVITFMIVFYCVRFILKIIYPKLVTNKIFHTY